MFLIGFRYIEKNAHLYYNKSRLLWSSILSLIRTTLRISRIFHEGVGFIGATSGSLADRRSVWRMQVLLPQEILNVATHSAALTYVGTVFRLRGDSQRIPRRRASSEEGFPWEVPARISGPIRDRESRVELPMCITAHVLVTRAAT